jgi:hypothetical protein
MADLQFPTFFAFQDVRYELRGGSENWQAALAASAEFKKSGLFLLARFHPMQLEETIYGPVTQCSRRSNGPDVTRLGLDCE